MGFIDFLSDVADTVCEKASEGFDYVCENPVKSLLVVAIGVTTGGAALTAAGPIAAMVGATGALGAASTGTAIGTLKGAALVSASLAKIGGGALAVGGGGMATGATVVGGVGAATGLAAGAGAVKVADVLTEA